MQKDLGNCDNESIEKNGTKIKYKKQTNDNRYNRPQNEDTEVMGSLCLLELIVKSAVKIAGNGFLCDPLQKQKLGFEEARQKLLNFWAEEESWECSGQPRTQMDPLTIQSRLLLKAPMARLKFSCFGHIVW